MQLLCQKSSLLNSINALPVQEVSNPAAAKGCLQNEAFAFFFKSASNILFLDILPVLSLQ